MKFHRFMQCASLLLVAFGQPARTAWLCPIVATVGFALFLGTLPSSYSKKKRFWTAFAWFSAVQMIQLSWMTSITFQGYYILCVYAFVCAVLGAQFGLFACLLPKNEMHYRHVFTLAAAWTLLEWSRTLLACGFSWNPIGLALSFHPIPLQCASLFGIFGLSFWVMLVNMCALKRAFFLWGLLASAPYLFGYAHLHYRAREMTSSEKALRVALVQTGLLPSEKVLLRQKEESFIPPLVQWENILSYLKEKQCDQWDLIVLPEAVVPLYADMPKHSFEAVRQLLTAQHGEEIELFFPPLCLPFAKGPYVSNLFLAQTLANFYNADVLLGLDHVDLTLRKNFNSAFVCSPRHHAPERYDKRILLPLAEYLPFKWLLRFTTSYGITDFFSKGESSFTLGQKWRMSVSICYEETFSEAIRQGVREDSDLLVNLTNDNYYPYSLLPEQHFAHARLRAVENGLPLVRACNTGVTAVIDSLGRIVSRFGNKKEEFKRGALDCCFAPYKYKTLFSFWGDRGILGICIAILIYHLFKNKIMLKKKF